MTRTSPKLSEPSQVLRLENLFLSDQGASQRMPSAAGDKDAELSSDDMWLFVTMNPATLVKPTNELPPGEEVDVDRDEPLETAPYKDNLKEGLRGSRLEERFLEDDVSLLDQLQNCTTVEEEKALIRRAIAAKSKETGISSWVLRHVFNRGKRSWAKSDSWNSANSVHWGLVRVNSFCCGGKARQADRDLWEKHRVRASEQ